MELLLIVGLVIAVFLLWKRMTSLECTVRELSNFEPPSARGSAPNFPAANPASRPASIKPSKAKPRPVDSEFEDVLRGPVAGFSSATPAAGTAAASFSPDPIPARSRPSLPDFNVPKISLNFEDIFGRLLPIWAGGITLAVAGFFLVRYSIDAGLLTPAVRAVLGFVFGTAMIGAAETAYRMEDRVQDTRVRQALSGAGIATLYASFYLAGSLYGLIGTALAFGGLALVTALGIGLSYRFGLPSAVLGLVGGFAVPALVGGNESNVPVLAAYLALVTAGLVLTGKRQQRAWLGLAALGGGLGWGMLLLLSAVRNDADQMALGVYIVLLGAVLPLFARGAKSSGLVRLGAAGVGSLQLAGLIHQGGYSPITWGLYLLLGSALAFFGWKESRMREAAVVAAAVGLCMLAIWPAPEVGLFAGVTVIFASIYALVPLIHVKRSDAGLIDHLQMSGVSLGLIGVTYWQFGAPSLSGAEPLLALTALALAAIPLTGAWLIRPAGSADISRNALIAIASGLTGLFASGLMATPAWAAPMIAAVIAGGVFLLMRSRKQGPLCDMGWATAMAALVALIVTPDFTGELPRLFGESFNANITQAAFRWTATALPFLLLGIADHRPKLRSGTAAIAAVLAYSAAAQILPGDTLGWLAALAAILTAWRLASHRSAASALIVIAACWAAMPMLQWVAAGIEATGGRALLVSDLGSLRDLFTYLVPFTIAAAFMVWLAKGELDRWAKIVLVAGGVAALAIVHTVYKQAFGIDNMVDFVRLGLAERTVWQALLIGGSYAVWRLGKNIPNAELGSRALLAAGLAHFAWFSLCLHNSLWSEQAVGPAPIANLLLLSYGTAIAGAIIAMRWLPAERGGLMPVFHAALMALISMLALSLLRQMFAGSLLVANAVGSAEDLLRSLLGITLAVGFLLWASRIGSRSWRIGSLTLISLAVLKVFLFDTAGLEGLARIASFMALGFSLIGVGWFYSRQFRAEPLEAKIQTI